jgi:hypothetical protein
MLCNAIQYTHNNGSVRRRVTGGGLSDNENKGLRAGFTTPTFPVHVNSFLPALAVFLYRAG